MYTIQFTSQSDDYNSFKQDIAMKMDFSEQPTWMEISDKFLEFLKANGYIFDIDEELRLVKEESFNEQEEEYAFKTEVKPKRRKANAGAKHK